MISPFDDLRGKTALITGASSGIGRQIAIDLSRFGVKCVITGRNKEQLNVTANMMHDETQCVVADLTVEDSLASLVAQVDGLNILIHSAGILAIAPVRQITESLMRSCVELNLMAPMTLTGKLLRAGKIEKGGSIVFLSSVGASVGIAGNAIYAATKAGLVSFSRCLAVEVAKHGIRSNCICPSYVDTPMIDAVGLRSALIERYKLHPLGAGKVTDISNAALYLTSDLSRWVTGQAITIDGGYSFVKT